MRKYGNVVIFFLLVALMACVARPANPFLGRWCTDPPSSLLYEYQEDGSVHLFIESGEYRVFRYQLHPGSTLRLFDGMGRMLEYRYAVEGQGITLYDPGRPDAPTDHLTPPSGDACR